MGTCRGPTPHALREHRSDTDRYGLLQSLQTPEKGQDCFPKTAAHASHFKLKQRASPSYRCRQPARAKARIRTARVYPSCPWPQSTAPLLVVPFWLCLCGVKSTGQMRTKCLNDRVVRGSERTRAWYLTKVCGLFDNSDYIMS